MWFKKCKAYRLPETPDAAVLTEALAYMQFAPPQGLDWFCDGFDNPQPFTPLVFRAGELWAFAFAEKRKCCPVRWSTMSWRAEWPPLKSKKTAPLAAKKSRI